MDLRTGGAGDFTFETIEAAESPCLAIRRAGGVCRIEAAWQRFVVSTQVECAALLTLAEFARRVSAETKEQLQIHVDDLFSLSADRPVQSAGAEGRSKVSVARAVRG